MSARITELAKILGSSVLGHHIARSELVPINALVGIDGLSPLSATPCWRSIGVEACSRFALRRPLRTLAWIDRNNRNPSDKPRSYVCARSRRAFWLQEASNLRNYMFPGRPCTRPDCADLRSRQLASLPAV